MKNKQKIVRIKGSELSKMISEMVQRALDEGKRQQSRRIIDECQIRRMIRESIQEALLTEGAEISQQEWDIAVKREIDFALSNPEKFNSGYARIRVYGKCNFVDRNGHLLSPNQWFDYAGFFDDGAADVKLNGEHYLIDTKGNLIPN